MQVVIIFARLCAISVATAVRDHWRRAAWAARGVSISRGTVIREDQGGTIELGRGVAVGFGTLLLSTSEGRVADSPVSRLSVSAGTAINEYCNLRASGGEIIIGCKCIVAQMVTMVASNHSTDPDHFMIEQPWSVSPHSVVIGDDVWIGASVVLLPGCRIGSGSVIAAGAVVRGCVPPGEIWGGVPARFLRSRERSDSSTVAASRQGRP